MDFSKIKNKNPEIQKQASGTPENLAETKQKIDIIGSELVHLERRLKNRELELQEKVDREKDAMEASALLKQLETA